MKLENSRLTIRLPTEKINMIDLFVRAGEYSSRSEVIRHAVNDFVKNYVDTLIEKAEKTRKLEEIVTSYERNAEYLKK